MPALGCPLLGTLLLVHVVLLGHLLECFLGCPLLLPLRSCQCSLLAFQAFEEGMQALLAGCLSVFALGCPLLGTLLLVKVVFLGHLMEFLLCRSLLLPLRSCHFATTFLVEKFVHFLLAQRLTMFALGCPLLGTLLLVEAVLGSRLLQLLLCC